MIYELLGELQVGRDVAAVEKGADPLTALSRAAAAAGQGGTVVLVDSGLQTVAPLDFSAAELLDADTTRHPPTTSPTAATAGS